MDAATGLRGSGVDPRLSRQYGQDLPVYSAANPPPAREVDIAQKVTGALEDDLDGGPADETVRFGLEDPDYEIDLSSKNACAFRKQLTPFIEHARRPGGDWPAGRPGRRPAASVAATSERGRKTMASRS